MCFHTKEKHNEFLRTVISEHRYLKRIQELKPQEEIVVGCRCSAEADISLANKRRNEAEGSARRERDSTHVVSNNHGVLNALMSPDSAETFLQRVKVVSNRVSEDARGPFGTNDCWKCLVKVRCSSNVQEYGYHEN
ncbi:hypothetical protein MTR_3g081410 [Medicago truncatula]|uniref:Uncharacterized protein n=1 Tax=Medicago truncatula TaxID=3880 RepID=A0A072V1C3_MEDTR|nr:hypothetical protein MTR_3g081410 [Medicago truncatula]